MDNFDLYIYVLCIGIFGILAIILIYIYFYYNNIKATEQIKEENLFEFLNIKKYFENTN